MKTKQQFQEAIDELAEVCRKHGVVLIGTCASEGVFGEISLFDSEEGITGWAEPGGDSPFGIVTETFLGDGDLCVYGIGQFNKRGPS